jgi:2-polyprenyl-6-methoxyphenol hydroxylase-like FAD-dependent oxidoreductase
MPLDGHGFTAIARIELIRLLQRHCAAAGVEMRFETRVERIDPGQYDLVIASDGIHSSVRTQFADDFVPRSTLLENKYVWYGTHRVFDTLSLIFREHEGGFYVAHTYRFSPHASTFIVECDAGTWRRAGFAAMSDEESRAYCASIFADDLDGNPLLSNNSAWTSFNVLTNERWSFRNVVLIGDALRSVHFSIGSGTRLALEDAIALHRAIEAGGDVSDVLVRFEEMRRPTVEKITAAAARSYNWYEHFHERMALPPLEFAMSYATRSGRISRAQLEQICDDARGVLPQRERGPEFVVEHTHGFAGETRVLAQIKIAAGGDAFKFLGAEGELKQQVHGGAGVMGEFLGLLPVFLKSGAVQTDALIEPNPFFHPVLVPHLPTPVRLRLSGMSRSGGFGYAPTNGFHRFIWPDEELELHLFEFTRTEGEIAGRHLVSEGLPHLGDAERHLLTRSFEHVLELGKNRLSSLGPKIGDIFVGFNRADDGFEHQVEGAGLGLFTVAFSGQLARLLRARHVAHLIGTEPGFAGFAVDHWVAESIHVSGSLPDARMHNDGGVQSRDVVPEPGHGIPPELLDVPF